MAEEIGVDRIAAERRRQVEKENWDQDHDDNHVGGEVDWADLMALHDIAEQAKTYVPDHPVRDAMAYSTPAQKRWMVSLAARLRYVDETAEGTLSLGDARADWCRGWSHGWT